MLLQMEIFPFLFVTEYYASVCVCVCVHVVGGGSQRGQERRVQGAPAQVQRWVQKFRMTPDRPLPSCSHRGTPVSEQRKQLLLFQDFEMRFGLFTWPCKKCLHC